MNDPRHFTVPGSGRIYDRNKLLLVLLFPLAMALLQVSSVDNLLTVIRSAIGASSSSIQWVLSGYALATGIVLVPCGRLGDIFGRSSGFVVGLSIFTVGSIACGLVSDATTLNLMRALQGVGAGIFSPQVTGLIQQYYQGRDRGRAFGYVGLVIAMSVAVGPVMSGVLVSWLGNDQGWRWSFLLNGPIGIFGIIAAIRWLPFGKERRTIGRNASRVNAEFLSAEKRSGSREGRRRGERIDLDPIGMTLLCLTVVSVMIPFMTAYSWRWLLLGAGGLLGSAWTLWEHSYKVRGRIPMVDLSLFSLRSFSYCTAIAALQFLGSTSVFVILAMYLQSGLDQSALAVGLVGLPAAIASGAASLWAGPRAYEHGKRIQAFALLLVIVSILLTTAAAWYVDRGAHVALMSAPLIPIGLGFGAMGSANQTQAMLDVPAKHGGTAGGVIQTAQRMSTAIGNAIVTALVFAILSEGERQGRWFLAFALGMGLIALIVTCALAVALAFLRSERRTDQ